MTSRLLAAVICVAGLPGLVNAQQAPAHDCEWLLKYGVYDYQRVAIDRYTVEHFRFLLSQSKAETVEKFIEEAGGGGLNVVGIFDINLGGKSARNDFRGLQFL